MTESTPIEYGDIQISRHLGRGIVVDTAPENAKAHIGFIADAGAGVIVDDGAIRIADQVLYEITGYDPAESTLTLRLALDWRPGQKDDPNTEPTDDLDITEYLVVHRYRTDRGEWAWCWRCWGDGACGGHLALDLSNRAYAERKAREHLAEAHAAVPTATKD